LAIIKPNKDFQPYKTLKGAVSGSLISGGSTMYDHSIFLDGKRVITFVKNEQD
jgi:hypothetical protein